MLFNHTQLIIQETNKLGNNGLEFIFRGKFTKECSELGCAAWSSYFEKNIKESFYFLWDCSEMAGFELSARTVWYNSMNQHKKRITSVCVVSQNIMVRSAAKIMLQYFGIKCNILREKQELMKDV